MPIYEYECKSCCQVMEELQKFSDAPLKKCPHCGGKMHKKMSLNSFHLKGSGWYVTDYASKKGSASRPPKAAEESKPVVETKTAPTDSKDSSK